MNDSQPEVIHHKGPPAELIEKLTLANPSWGVDEWELWWCKWGKNRWPHWDQLSVCELCKCERKQEALKRDDKWQQAEAGIT